MIWKIGGCRRCGGDIFLEEDIDKSAVETCLQCGYYTMPSKQTNRNSALPGVLAASSKSAMLRQHAGNSNEWRSSP